VRSPAGQPAPAEPGVRRQPRRFGLLLLLLLATYLLSAFTSGGWVNFVQIVIFGIAAIMTLRASGAPRLTVRLILGFGLIGTVASAILALARVGQVGDGLANLWAGLVLLFTAVVIVRLVLRMDTVTMQSIFGAVSAYLILGLMFAAFYSAMFHFAGGKFFAGGRTGDTQTFQYFSFTTLTTLGYGDFTAAQSSGQAVAVIEALLGQVFLATLVARLVASFRMAAAPLSPPAPKGRPAAPPQPRPGHRQNAGIDRHGTVAARRGTSPASSAGRRPGPGAP
jgi:Ion channel